MLPTTHLVPYTFNAAELTLLLAVGKDVQHKLESDYDDTPGAPLFTQYPDIKHDMDDFLEDVEGKKRVLITGLDELNTIEVQILDIVAAVLTRGTQGAADFTGIRERMGRDLSHPIQERSMKELHIKLHEPVRKLVNSFYYGR